jgi:pseudouridine-5'-phosphate glycosidase
MTLFLVCCFVNLVVTSLYFEAIMVAILGEKGIKGKDSTPFLLKTICDLTGGESLESNISLVLNNAKIGSEIAKEYSKIIKEDN